MNFAEIYDALERIKYARQKQVLLKAYLSDYEFRQVVWFALEPTITFGVGEKTLDTIEAMYTRGTIFNDNVFSHCSIPYEAFSTLCSRLMTRILSGNDAVEAIANFYRHVKINQKAWNVIRRVLTKTLDIGATAKTVNKVYPGLVTTFDCMLAHPFEEDRIIQWPVAVEPKLDGMRVLVMITPSEVNFFTRSGKEVPSLAFLKDDVQTWISKTNWKKGVVIDAEVVSGDFAKTMSQARNKSNDASDAVLNCFDALPLEGWKKQVNMEDYSSRRADLEKLINSCHIPDRFKLVPRYLARNVQEIEAFYRAFRKRGLEGAIVKPLDHKYQWKRSFDWMKMKDEFTFDLPIIGFKEGTKKYSGMLGALLVDFNGVVVDVGTGITDAERTEIWNNQQSYLGRIVEVGAHEVTPDKSLRHPRLLGLRDDKQGDNR